MPGPEQDVIARRNDPKALTFETSTRDAITTSPRVIEISTRFHEVRAQDAVEAIIRSRP